MPETQEVNIMPEVDLKHSSVDDETSAAKAPSQSTGATPSRWQARLPPNTSTVPVLSGEEGNQVGPLGTPVEEQLSADDTGSDLSSVSHQQQHRAAGSRDHKPSHIYNPFVRLQTRVELYRTETSFLLESVSEEEPLVMRVQGKVDHYTDVFDRLEEAMNKQLRNICQGKNQPLPGSPSRWKMRRDKQKEVDDLPPVDTSTPNPIPDLVQDQPVQTSVPALYNLHLYWSYTPLHLTWLYLQSQSCPTTPYLLSLELPLARLDRHSLSRKCPYRPVPWATSTPESRPLSRCKPGPC